MTPLRDRMIEDMKLIGLSEGTQRTYLTAVSNLARHFNRSPDLVTEEQVRTYLVAMAGRGLTVNAHTNSRPATPESLAPSVTFPYSCLFNVPVIPTPFPTRIQVPA